MDKLWYPCSVPVVWESWATWGISVVCDILELWATCGMSVVCVVFMMWDCMGLVFVLGVSYLCGLGCSCGKWVISEGACICSLCVLQVVSRSQGLCGLLSSVELVWSVLCLCIVRWRVCWAVVSVKEVWCTFAPLWCVRPLVCVCCGAPVFSWCPV